MMSNSVMRRIKIDANFNINEYAKSIRLNYIMKCINHKPLNQCPECGAPVTSTEDSDEIYCTRCGLITSASIQYVAGKKIKLPHGIRLK